MGNKNLMRRCPTEDQLASRAKFSRDEKKYVSKFAKLNTDEKRIEFAEYISNTCGWHFRYALRVLRLGLSVARSKQKLYKARSENKKCNTNAKTAASRYSAK